MKARSMLAAIPLMLLAVAAQGQGNAEAGDATYQAVCSNCHFEDDFAGTAAEEISGLITAIKSGTTEHKGGNLADLSDEDIANLAAYFASFQ